MMQRDIMFVRHQYLCHETRNKDLQHLTVVEGNNAILGIGAVYLEGGRS